MFEILEHLPNPYVHVCDKSYKASCPSKGVVHFLDPWPHSYDFSDLILQ